MIYLLAIAYTTIGVVVAAVAPTIIDALTPDDKTSTQNIDRLGLIAMLWPIAVALCVVIVVIRTAGYLGQRLPTWLGNAATWVRTQSTQWTTTKEETPTNVQPTTDNPS